MPFLTIIVFDTTPAEAGAIRDYLAGAGMVHHDDGDAARQIRLGHAYSNGYGATAGEVAAYLEANAPTSTWAVWSAADGDEFGELGELVRYVPALGRFSAECGSDGAPYLGGKDLDALVDEAASGDPVAAARRIGRPWRTAMDAALSGQDGAVVPVTEPVEDPPPVPGATLAELSAQLHMRCCPQWVDDGRCALTHRADFTTVAEAVVALGWRPWSAAGE